MCNHTPGKATGSPSSYHRHPKEASHQLCDYPGGVLGEAAGVRDQMIVKRLLLCSNSKSAWLNP